MIPSRYRGIERTQKEINVVLEQIKAEIQAYDDKLKLCKASPSIDYIMQIIDKYLKGDTE